jgi:hypothetical protein
VNLDLPANHHPAESRRTIQIDESRPKACDDNDRSAANPTKEGTVAFIAQESQNVRPHGCSWNVNHRAVMLQAIMMLDHPPFGPVGQLRAMRGPFAATAQIPSLFLQTEVGARRGQTELLDQ